MTGKYEHELPNTLIGVNNANFVDKVYPFLWKNYSNDLNYATLYAEDWPSIGTFNYRMLGMKKQPTTHYMRQFQLLINNEGMLKESSTLCLHGRSRLQVMLDYSNDFMHNYYKNGFFGLTFLSDYTHDQSNHIKWVDEILLNFLKDFISSDFSQNTILILFSDHGPRFSNIRSTMKGLLDERNPFFSIYLPKQFQNRFPEQYKNFKSNINNLVTPFDIHETMIDLSEMIKTGNQSQVPTSRKISLFRQIPIARSCNDAGIETHWCACLKRKKLSINNYTIELAQKVVDFMNELMAHLNKCLVLKLSKVNKIYLLEASKSVRSKKSVESNESFLRKLIDRFIRPMLKEVEVVKNFEQYQIQLETSPNFGIYETTINVERNFKKIEDYSVNINKNLISRLNKYGNQSICIHDEFPDLRKYCFCK